MSFASLFSLQHRLSRVAQLQAAAQEPTACPSSRADQLRRQFTPPFCLALLVTMVFPTSTFVTPTRPLGCDTASCKLVCPRTTTTHLGSHTWTHTECVTISETFSASLLTFHLERCGHCRQQQGPSAGQCKHKRPVSSVPVSLLPMPVCHYIR